MEARVSLHVVRDGRLEPRGFELGDDFGLSLEWVSALVGFGESYAYDFGLPGSAWNLELLGNPDLDENLDWGSLVRDVAFLGLPFRLEGRIRVEGYDGRVLTCAFTERARFWQKAMDRHLDGLVLTTILAGEYHRVRALLYARLRTEHVICTGLGPARVLENGCVRVGVLMRFCAVWFIRLLVERLGYRCVGRWDNPQPRKAYVHPGAPCMEVELPSDSESDWWKTRVMLPSVQLRDTGLSVGGALRDLCLTLGVRLHVDEDRMEVALVSLETQHRQGARIRLGRLLCGMRPEIVVGAPTRLAGEAIPGWPDAMASVLNDGTTKLQTLRQRLEVNDAFGRKRELSLSPPALPPGVDAEGAAVARFHWVPMGFPYGSPHYSIPRYGGAAGSPSDSEQIGNDPNSYRVADSVVWKRLQVKGPASPAGGLEAALEWQWSLRDRASWECLGVERDFGGDVYVVEGDTQGAPQFKWRFVGSRATARRYRGVRLREEGTQLERGRLAFRAVQMVWRDVLVSKTYTHEHIGDVGELEGINDTDPGDGDGDSGGGVIGPGVEPQPGGPGVEPQPGGPGGGPGTVNPRPGAPSDYHPTIEIDGMRVIFPHRPWVEGYGAGSLRMRYKGTLVTISSPLAVAVPRLWCYFTVLEGARRGGGLYLRMGDSVPILFTAGSHLEGVTKESRVPGRTAIAKHEGFYKNLAGGGYGTVSGYPHPQERTQESEKFVSYYHTVGNPYESRHDRGAYDGYLEAWVRAWACALEGDLADYREEELFEEMGVNPSHRIQVGCQMLLRASITVRADSVRIERARAVLWQDPSSRPLEMEEYVVGNDR